MTVLTKVAAATPGRPPSRPSRLLVLGLLAGPLFTVGHLVLGAVRDDHSVLRDPISSLASGPLGWVQIVNFVAGGLLVMLFAAGVRRSLRPGPGATAVPALVSVSGVGLIGSGVFLFDLPGFGALFFAMVAGAVTFARRGDKRFAAGSAGGAAVVAVLFAVTVAGLVGLVPVAGLWPRLGVSAGLLWLVLLAVRLRSR
jgi:hypothetical membrane protein